VKLDFIELSTAIEEHATSAVIPASYMEDENLRVTMYRKIAQAATETEIDRLHEELRDRFGPLPEPLDRLLKIARLRIIAAGKEIQSIEVQDDKIMMMRLNDYLMTNGKFPRLTSGECTARLDELLQIVSLS
jgi:transcription-repair coupling factor (superfamily II helicase)